MGVETGIQKQILDFLHSIGVGAWRNQTGRRGGITYGLCVGSSDIIGRFHGLFLCIEVKQPGEEPTADQQEFIDDTNNDGGIGFCAHSLTEAREKLLYFYINRFFSKEKP